MGGMARDGALGKMASAKAWWRCQLSARGAAGVASTGSGFYLRILPIDVVCISPSGHFKTLIMSG